MLEDGLFLRACSVPMNASIGDRHLDSDVCVWWALIDMFAKCSADLISARKLFEKMPERNVVTWTLMMTRCTQLGCPKNAVDLFLDMLASGLCRIDLHLQLFRRHVPGWSYYPLECNCITGLCGLDWLQVPVLDATWSTCM